MNGFVHIQKLPPGSPGYHLDFTPSIPSPTVTGGHAPYRNVPGEEELVGLLKGLRLRPDRIEQALEKWRYDGTEDIPGDFLEDELRNLGLL